MYNTLIQFFYFYCRLLKIIDKRVFDPFFKYDFIWKQTSYFKEQEKYLNYINTFVDEIVKNRHKELLKQQLTISDLKNKKLTLVDSLLLSKIDGQPLTNEDIRGEVNTFMFAVSCSKQK